MGDHGQYGAKGSGRGKPRVTRACDLVVLTAGPQPDVLTDPPLLVIEILSPDDSYSDTQERAQDYRAMGVEVVWIIDPKTHMADAHVRGRGMD